VLTHESMPPLSRTTAFDFEDPSPINAQYSLIELPGRSS
jgi:hypothetical protein